MVYLGPYPTSQQSPWMRLLPHNSLHRPSSIVTTASLDPAPASQSSLQAQNFLKSTSPDPAPASHCPPKGQLLPHGHLPRPSSCFTVASEAQMSSSPGHKIQAQNVHKSASQGPAPAFRWPLQAQLLPQVTSTGCVLLLALPGGPTPASEQLLLAQLLPSSWWPLKAQKCLKSSFPGPPSASQWPGQAQLLRDNGLSRPSFCFTDMFPKQARTCLPATLTGPNPASH
ncbi:PREDICTED: uncharacterized protein LOC108519752 [Rhinopithecus bieti]|uniref:uncharacterized protein LOC108519752 n=1 Tax=Rhinopithecus bieti TaxID=61621 RepID=UPI00083BEA6D|nr:PREDICTED: uncharacterized protein LOC108519752 [Rhinopithecus bieti]